MRSPPASRHARVVSISLAAEDTRQRATAAGRASKVIRAEVVMAVATEAADITSSEKVFVSTDLIFRVRSQVFGVHLRGSELCHLEGLEHERVPGEDAMISEEWIFGIGS